MERTMPAFSDLSSDRLDVLIAGAGKVGLALARTSATPDCGTWSWTVPRGGKQDSRWDSLTLLPPRRNATICRGWRFPGPAITGGAGHHSAKAIPARTSAEARRVVGTHRRPTSGLGEPRSHRRRHSARARATSAAGSGCYVDCSGIMIRPRALRLVRWPHSQSATGRRSWASRDGSDEPLRMCRVETPTRALSRRSRRAQGKTGGATRIRAVKLPRPART